MIKQVDISGDHYEINEATRKYVTRKIGRLDRFLSRHARKSVGAEVVLKQINKAHDNKYEASANIFVPGKVLNASSSTMNILAAIDIVESKLSTQLRKYNQTMRLHSGRRNLFARFKRRRQTIE